ncbi:hypothetical protein [Pedobacter sp. NJ-S-72]
MKGKELIQFLGYSADHPEFIEFLKANEVDIKQLPDPAILDKKEKKNIVKIFKQGFRLDFERDRSNKTKNMAGTGPIYLNNIVFFKPELTGAPAPLPVQLPFGLHFLDNAQTLTAKFGSKNVHGTVNSPYYEADESDYFYESHLKSYHIYVYFNRGDLQEKLQEIMVKLRE